MIIKTIARISLGTCLVILSFGTLLQSVAWATDVEDSNTVPAQENSADLPPSEQTVSSPIQDPLNSPHPVPWSWVVETQTMMQAEGRTGVRYYRSPALLSPDGTYAAYSRIQLYVDTEAYRNRVDSVLFVENINTGNLGVINASSPFAKALGADTPNPSPASVSLLIPISWSANSQQLLAREFDAILNSDDLTDYAIVWDRRNNETRTIAPQGMFYDSAVLLGWSGRNPEQVLFRAGEFGQDLWALWNVSLDGATAIAMEDEPIVIGEQVINPWDGPQAYWVSK